MEYNNQFLLQHSRECAAMPSDFIQQHSNTSQQTRQNNIPIQNNLTPLNTGITNNEIDLGICKYCDIKLNLANKGLSIDICSSPGCFEYKNQTCNKILQNCNHQCFGATTDAECLPCLYTYCNSYDKSNFQQHHNSQCCICLYPISKYPATKLPCNHIIHKKCIEDRLIARWSGKTISFLYLKCPLCQTFISDLTDMDLLDLLKPEIDFYERIKKVAIENFENEKIEESEDYKSYCLGNSTKGDKLNYVFDKFALFICQQCDAPYYAGLKNCLEQEVEEDLNIRRLCLDCFDYTKIKGITNCDLHGRKQIQYKCKFCCDIASHFCFGTTHFCEECHLKQLIGDYLTAKTEFDPCNPETCFLKGDHPPNGEEFGLFCILCNK
jgi:hypothetical protein